MLILHAPSLSNTSKVKMSSSNNGVSALFLLAVLLAASHLAADIDSFLYGSCKTVAGGSGVVSVTFCIEALSSDNRSHDTNGFKDFAVVTIDLVTANATSTKSKIDSMLQNGGGDDDDSKRRCLQSCQAAYAGVLQAQPGISTDVQGGRLPEAISALEKSASVVQECENGFGKSNVTSPLTMEDDDSFGFSKLAAAFLRWELGS